LHEVKNFNSLRPLAPSASKVLYRNDLSYDWMLYNKGHVMKNDIRKNIQHNDSTSGLSLITDASEICGQGEGEV
jgi:hypothetical protein